MILVDSNVLIDVLGVNQAWRLWSIQQLESAAQIDQLAVNQIAFAEVAPRMGSLEQFREKLDAFEIEFIPFADDSAFVAGLAFLEFRTRSSSARIVLPDFFIGGQAATPGATILTRDPRFYRSYFPQVPLITPSKEEE
jgi:predicted nucleic acid-binding protein